MRTISITKESIEKETSIREVAPFMPGFLLDRESELILLKEASLAKDYKMIRSLAHNWKGFCSPYGFKGLGELSELLESAIDDNNAELIQNILDHMEFYLQTKREVLFLN